jgi:hypothetical protein
MSIRTNPNGIRASCRERPGGAIADEAQLGNRRFDLEAGVFAHQVGIVEHIGHRADRHTSVPSDILNARPRRSRVAIIGLLYPSPRLCHVGRLYLDRAMAEAIQPQGAQLDACSGPRLRSKLDTNQS